MAERNEDKLICESLSVSFNQASPRTAGLEAGKVNPAHLSVRSWPPLLCVRSSALSSCLSVLVADLPRAEGHQRAGAGRRASPVFSRLSLSLQHPQSSRKLEVKRAPALDVQSRRSCRQPEGAAVIPARLMNGDTLIFIIPNWSGRFN